jgi:hypothetical protein
VAGLGREIGGGGLGGMDGKEEKIKEIRGRVM